MESLRLFDATINSNSKLDYGISYCFALCTTPLVIPTKRSAIPQISWIRDNFPNFIKVNTGNEHPNQWLLNLSDLNSDHHNTYIYVI